MGAKNHAVIMPDAHREAAVNALAGAAFGAAGKHRVQVLLQCLPVCEAHALRKTVSKSAGAFYSQLPV
jgi:hypothetical protein